jgi:hypothetical protein
METRRGRRSVIDLTAPSESPPEIPRPLIATAAIAPRRRLRDGSHSSRSSTATLSDISGPSNAIIAGGSRNRPTVIERRQDVGIRARNGSSSSASGSGIRRDAGNQNEGPRAKRARLGLNSGEESTTRSAGSGAPSRSSRPSESTSRGSGSRARPASVDDFDVDSSDEALVEAARQSSAGVVPDSEDEEDKTDAMTVNTDLLDDMGNDIEEYQMVNDSSQESPAIPLRAAAREEEEVDELADDVESNGNRNEENEEDDFEVVSHVKRDVDASDAQELKGPNREERAGVRKGKGKAPVAVDPDEPPENLLASFGELIDLI